MNDNIKIFYTKFAKNLIKAVYENERTDIEVYISM